MIENHPKFENIEWKINEMAKSLMNRNDKEEVGA
jgi:hypothetical protein